MAAWAAREAWPSLEELTLVEIEPEMVAAGRELLPDARWLTGDVSTAPGPAELVVVSYVLGELAEVPGTAALLWEHATDSIAFIEPGNTGGPPPDPRGAGRP